MRPGDSARPARCQCRGHSLPSAERGRGRGRGRDGDNLRGMPALPANSVVHDRRGRAARLVRILESREFVSRRTTRQSRDRDERDYSAPARLCGSDSSRLPTTAISSSLKPALNLAIDGPQVQLRIRPIVAPLASAYSRAQNRARASVWRFRWSGLGACRHHDRA